MEKYLLPRNFAFVFLSGLALAGIARHFFGLPVERFVLSLPVFCPFEAFTGLPCPGCGMTRAFGALAGGNVMTALSHNPFVFLFLFLCALSIMPAAYVGRHSKRARGLMSSFFAVSAFALLFRWLFVKVIPLLLR
jgi:hypothetical protein